MSIQTRIKKSTLSKLIWIKVSLRLYNNAYTLLKEFEYEIPALMSEDKVNMINVKLNRLHKLKSEEKRCKINWLLHRKCVEIPCIFSSRWTNVVIKEVHL